MRRSTIPLTGPQRTQLAAHIVRSEKSIVRAYRREPVSEHLLESVRRGALALGLPLPPDRLHSKAA